MNDASWVAMLDDHLKVLATELKRIGNLIEKAKPVAWVEGEPPALPVQARFMGVRAPRLDGTLYANQPSDAEAAKAWMKKRDEYDQARSVRSPDKR